nr:MAG TPA: hypothetical protein [Caudoviricetes sp.]
MCACLVPKGSHQLALNKWGNRANRVNLICAHNSVGRVAAF